MSTTILKGTVISAPALGQLEITEKGYLVAEDGIIRGVYQTLPADLEGLAVEDYGDALILQSFADLHLHAPQYPMLGMGMDLPLLQRELADMLGYSPIHINRAVRDLRDRKLVAWQGTGVDILDWDGLARLARFDPTYLQLQRQQR